jgi:hypothetical protein
VDVLRGQQRPPVGHREAPCSPGVSRRPRLSTRARASRTLASIGSISLEYGSSNLDRPEESKVTAPKDVERAASATSRDVELGELAGEVESLGRAVGDCDEQPPGGCHAVVMRFRATVATP